MRSQTLYRQRLRCSHAQGTGASSIFVMATHEEQAMTWKSSGGALQNFNAVEDFGKSKVQSAGLAALTRMNMADVVRAMPLLRQAVKDDNKPK